MHYIFEISFFKFLISNSFRKIIKIIKTYHIIIIDVTQTIDRHFQIYNHVDFVLL